MHVVVSRLQFGVDVTMWVYGDLHSVATVSFKSGVDVPKKTKSDRAFSMQYLAPSQFRGTERTYRSEDSRRDRGLNFGDLCE